MLNVKCTLDVCQLNIQHLTFNIYFTFLISLAKSTFFSFLKALKSFTMSPSPTPGR